MSSALGQYQTFPRIDGYSEALLFELCKSKNITWTFSFMLFSICICICCSAAYKDHVFCISVNYKDSVEQVILYLYNKSSHSVAINVSNWSSWKDRQAKL